MKGDQIARATAFLLCLAALAWGGIGGRSLQPPDEQREAEIAREMTTGGSPLIPRLAGRPFVEKPPLYYWVSSAAMKTLGRVVGLTAAAQGVSFLCAVLLLLVIRLVGGKYLGRRGAFTLVLVLASMLGFLDAAQKVLTDPLLMFLTGAAILLFFAGLERAKPACLLGGYLAAGLAFLTKGLIGWALIGIPGIALALLYFREIRRHPHLHLLGVLFLLVPPLAWAALFRLQGGPELWRQWLIENQAGRFLGSTGHLGHIKGPFYYGELLPLALLPWTPAVIGWIVHRGWRQWKTESTGARNLFITAAVWSFGGLLLLSLAGTKRNIYLFPLLPGFAVLAASYLENRPAAWVRVLLRLITVLLLLASLYLAFFNPVAGEAPWHCSFSFPALLVAAIGGGIFLTSRKDLPICLAGITAVFYLSCQFTFLPVIDGRKSYRPMVTRLTAAIPDGQRNRVCGWKTDERTVASFAFYGDLYLSDPGNPARLADVLRGEDGEYGLVIVRREHLLQATGELPPWKILAGRKAETRDYLLISGTDDQ